MATLIQEEFLETVTMLNAEETARFDEVFDGEPAPVDNRMVAAFAAAQQIKAD